ncbi:MAG: hypothetical protein KME49_14755 [Brasilonema octagenarum HA4186-MV1]|uniref:Uncharacterized protein n=1 Tax=Brasilonema octagenarum UFV-OR1 TaxID=417115 RepID=A0ABX1MBS1_9CYAN|nr:MULTISPECIES: hypothetical protein [Brasilonema]MBW4626718.1 hypothetical protein [Brasilonema octagenarum HA4186-MV1]NMF64481.1 hypothetical protein [Brasilonema octagenarum UFV-OR1]
MSQEIYFLADENYGARSDLSVSLFEKGKWLYTEHYLLLMSHQKVMNNKVSCRVDALQKIVINLQNNGGENYG